MACLGQQGLAHLTIRSYLSGVQQVHLAHCLQDPHIDDMAWLRQVLRGVKVKADKEGKPPRSRLPIIPSILEGSEEFGSTGKSSFGNRML